jgi:hypothetical protein
MWAVIGLALAVAGMGLGLWNGRPTASNRYAAIEYGMTSRSHRRFAILSVLFALAFVGALYAHTIPVIVVLAVYVLIFVLYATSFARGFSDV